VILWQVIGQSTEPSVVLQHVVTLGDALLVAALHVELHRMLPETTTSFIFVMRHNNDRPQLQVYHL